MLLHSTLSGVVRIPSPSLTSSNPSSFYSLLAQRKTPFILFHLIWHNSCKFGPFHAYFLFLFLFLFFAFIFLIFVISFSCFYFPYFFTEKPFDPTQFMEQDFDFAIKHMGHAAVLAARARAPRLLVSACKTIYNFGRIYDHVVKPPLKCDMRPFWLAGDCLLDAVEGGWVEEGMLVGKGTLSLLFVLECKSPSSSPPLPPPPHPPLFTSGGPLGSRATASW